MAIDPTKDKTQQAITDAEAAAAAKKAAREAANAEEIAALQALQAKELEGLQQYNAAQYSNLGQIVGDIQSKINVAKEKDETAQKRENAYRYISGLGDTLSSLANLVGVANKASNQQQTYNSHAVVQKAEEARKARKIEMEDLSTRLDEMKARQRDIQAAGSLKEAELKAKQDRETFQLKATQRTTAEDANKYYDEQIYRAERNARSDYENDRRFALQEKLYNMQYAKFLEDQEKTKMATIFPFSIGNGEFVEIPKDKINETSIRPIFESLPEEFKNLAKGKAVTTYDEFDNRQTEYATPTLEEQIAAISVAAQFDPAIRKKIMEIGGMTVNKAPKQNAEEKPRQETEPQKKDPLRATEEDILNNSQDSFYIGGNKYQKMGSGKSSFAPASGSHPNQNNSVNTGRIKVDY